MTGSAPIIGRPPFHTRETPSCVADTFLKSLAALAAAGALPLPASANANLKMMIPANPGGGWDTTGRAVGKALQDAGVASSVSYDNKGGAAGAIGLAQFVNGSQGDANALMTMGAVMLGGIITGKPPVSLSQATPIARLTTEYNVFVVPPDSKLKTIKDVVEQMKRDPGSLKWGSGYSEFAEYITAGKMRAIAVTSDARLKGRDVPTLKEQGITPEQRKALTDMSVKASQSTAWAESLEKNGWTPALMTGADFEKFVDDEFASLRAVMVKSGMI